MPGLGLEQIDGPPGPYSELPAALDILVRMMPAQIGSFCSVVYIANEVVEVLHLRNNMLLAPCFCPYSCLGELVNS